MIFHAVEILLLSVIAYTPCKEVLRDFQNWLRGREVKRLHDERTRAHKALMGEVDNAE